MLVDVGEGTERGLLLYVSVHVQVEEILGKLEAHSSDGKEAAKIIKRLPLEVQFPACASEAGHAPCLGDTTGNDVETLWPLLKSVRKEKDAAEAFVKTAAFMHERYMKSKRELSARLVTALYVCLCEAPRQTAGGGRSNLPRACL